VPILQRPTHTEPVQTLAQLQGVRMQREITTESLRNEAMDDLLSRWHNWLAPINAGRGYGKKSAGCGSYVASRQYDDENGALDAALEHRTMRTVQECYEQLQHPQSTYILTEARNLHTGNSVWRHPRLPMDPGELAEIRVEARGQMLRQMMRRGLVD
jgi:hypothetical protein